MKGMYTHTITPSIQENTQTTHRWPLILLALHNLRRCELWRAALQREAACIEGRHDPRQTKVGNLGVAALHEDVLRLEVAVDHTPGGVGCSGASVVVWLSFDLEQ
jgi:hypothetical protein